MPSWNASSRHRVPHLSALRGSASWPPCCQDEQSLHAEQSISSSQSTSPERIDWLCQVALLLPSSQLVLQRQALWCVPAVQAELADAQNGRAQGQ